MSNFSRRAPRQRWPEQKPARLMGINSRRAQCQQQPHAARKMEMTRGLTLIADAAGW